MSKNRVDLEMELSKRMTGEVYPELLLLMNKTKVPYVYIRTAEDGDEEVGPVRFSINVEGTIKDVLGCQDGMNNRRVDIIRALDVIRTVDAVDVEIEELRMEEDVRVFANIVPDGYQQPANLRGEADDEDDDYVPTEFSIHNINKCPVYENYKSVDYTSYCEQVLDSIERLFEKDKKIHSVMARINRIPCRRSVIVEKYKL